MKRVALLVALVSILIVGCTSSDEPETTSSSRPKAKLHGKIEFVPCGTNECAKFEVPMDYDKPKGRKLTLSMVKIPAGNPDERIGVLFVNPGGPGASAADFVKSAGSFIFSKEILDKFDIIGFDPRGVGESTKVNCAKSLDKLFDGVDYSPENDAELNKLFEVNKWFSDRCKKADSELLPFLSTKETVKDLEQIRKGLEEETINYLGYSYGTSIGQMYASMYPKNFRAMVIDGVVDLVAEPKDIAKQQIIGFEDALNSFFQYCKTNTCRFSGSNDPKTVFLQLMKTIDDSPIASQDDPDFKLGPSQLDIASAQALYTGEDGWIALDNALDAINRSQPSQMLELFSSYVGRSFDGTYDGSYQSFLSIGCADGYLGDTKFMRGFAQEMSTQAPIFGESSVYLGLPCSTWENAQPAESFDADATGSNPILVIGTTGDPATPVQWARNAAKYLKTGVLLEFNGEGHTAYGRGNACVDSKVADYFINLKVPDQKTC